MFNIAMENVDNSSQIMQIGYNADTRQLGIVFKGTNATYVYDDVPAEIWEGLKTSDSKGKYFYANIPKKFQYAKHAHGEGPAQ